jgi:hypothetical protein
MYGRLHHIILPGLLWLLFLPNSWDIFTDPFAVLGKVIILITHPLQFPGFYGMTLAVYIFLVLLFSFFQKVRLTGRSFPQIHSANYEI